VAGPRDHEAQGGCLAADVQIARMPRGRDSEALVRPFQDVAKSASARHRARGLAAAMTVGIDGAKPRLSFRLVLVREIVAEATQRLDPLHGLRIVLPCRCIIRPAQTPGEYRRVPGFEPSYTLRLTPAHDCSLLAMKLTRI
jgi:hypothetical protein